MPQEFLEFAVQYHDRLPLRIREYLHERGLADFVIDRYLIGWSGWRITIPVYDRSGGVSFFRLAKDPADPSDSPEMLSAPGGAVELYGWEHVQSAVDQVIVCDTELNRLLFESRGYTAVASTGGVEVFRRDWAGALSGIPGVYVCFPRNARGRAAAQRVGRLIRHAKIVTLPAQVGKAGTVAEYFLSLNRSDEDFDELLRQSKWADCHRHSASQERPTPA